MIRLITSAEDLVRDEAHRRAGVVKDLFRTAIRPVYRSTDGVLPIHVGTCTLFRVGTDVFVVTAAHIIDQHPRAELWIGGVHSIVPLSGMFSRTVAPNGDRSQDRFDFSVSPLTADLAHELGTVGCIEPHFISKGRREDRKHAMYVCIGYPNSQNKDMHAGRREVNAQLWMHVAPGRSKHQKLGKWGQATEQHLFVDFQKYASTTAGTRKRSTHPQGTSGGPVFYIGDFGIPDTYRVEATFQPMLEGITIEKPSGADALVAVKIGAIIDAMHQSS